MMSSAVGVGGWAQTPARATPPRTVRIGFTLDRDLDEDIARSEPAEPPTGLRRAVAEVTDVIDDAV